MRYFLHMLLLLALITPQAYAESSVFQTSATLPLDQAYDRVYQSLENNRFWVVFEADIGKNISGFAEKWGDEYNQQNLEGIRSMVFCNGWYANQVSNLDPAMLALCPMRLTLIHKQGVSTVLFARPTVIAADSPANQVLKELEDEVIASLQQAMSQ